jgi:cell division protease FtsH
MVNQLLTEMDGFRKNEMVFIVGTTNFLESVDAALLRPGRFEFLIDIPAPDPSDREAIAKIYDKKLETGLDDKLIGHLVRRTEGFADRVSRAPFTGDHIYAVFRALKRQALRTGSTEFNKDDIDKALTRKSQRSVVLSDEEERVVAVHEAGHAMLGIILEDARPPERIAIAQDQEGALGYVIHQAHAKPYAITAKELRAEICVGLGGMVAERMVFGDSSIGAFADLQQATRLARAMVLEYGMDSEVGPVVQLHENGRRRGMSQQLSNRVDEAVERILREELQRCEATLHEHKNKHTALTELLLEKKVLDGEMLATVVTAG